MNNHKNRKSNVVVDLLSELRQKLSSVNQEILLRLNERIALVEQIRVCKERHDTELYVPEREQRMLEELVEANPGPLANDVVKQLFREVFRASLNFMEADKHRSLKVARLAGQPNIVVHVGDRTVGREPIVIAGPCAVESEEQMDQVARGLSELGTTFLRGGAFKPRTSPYSFQGLGEVGLRILQEAGHRHNLKTVTEVVDTRTVEIVARYADVLQIGCRNMYNYELLKAVATIGKPVLLKRGLSATLDELLQSAEYIFSGGNEQVILCERGIRTFTRDTRNTLDISAIPILAGLSRLPVIVDVSHAAGRRDILPALARAALVAGAHGIMVEVHPNPVMARSDAEQQLDLHEFGRLLQSLQPEPIELQTLQQSAP